MSQKTIPPIRIGTRGSALALIQARMVADKLQALAPECSVEIVTIKASGDYNPQEGEQHLRDRGGKGLFTKELEDALLNNSIDLAVHSMKDVPTWMPDALEIAAVLPRADVRDALISPSAKSISALPQGATVGTSSLRRQSQLLALRPDLNIVPLRGNVDTRIKKLEAGQVQATLLAAAGLLRMNLAARIDAYIEPAEMLPAVSQGIIGVEIRKADKDLAALLQKLNCQKTFTLMHTERAMLEALDGSCQTPIAGLAAMEDGQVFLRGLVAQEQGRGVWKAEGRASAADAVKLGQEVGRKLRGMVPHGILPS